MKKTIQPNMRKVYGQTTNVQEMQQMNAVRKINNLLSSGTVSVTGPTQQRLLKPQQQLHQIQQQPKTIYVERGACYICDQDIGTSGTLVTEAFTATSNTKIPNKIGRVVGDAFMVIISVDDVICKRCLAMFNHMDKLESELERTKTNILSLLNSKYGISDTVSNVVNSVGDVKPPPAKVQRLSTGTVQYANRKTSNGGDTDDELISRKLMVSGGMSAGQSMQSATPTRILTVAGTTEPAIIDGQAFEQNNYGQPQQTVHIARQTNAIVQQQHQLQQQQQKKPIKIYKCMACDFKTTDLKQFQPHYETCRQQNGYRCKVCKKIFASMMALKTHSAEKHASDHTCTVCSIGFTNEAAFKKHMETSHPDAKIETGNAIIGNQIYACSSCSYKSSDKVIFDEHIKKHIKVKPFKCRICSQRFETREEAGVHAKTHCPDFYKCGFCSMSFPTKEQLLKHKETHRQQQQQQQQSLQGKQLMQQQQIVTQDLTTQKLLQDTIEEALRDSGESGPKINFFSCNMCSLTFIQENYYKHHMESHETDNKKTIVTPTTTVQSLIRQENRNSTATPTNIIQGQANQAIPENDLELMFEKMHSDKVENDGAVASNEGLVITSQESSTGGYTFNITMPSQQSEQTDANAGNDDGTKNKQKDGTNEGINSIGIDMPVLDATDDQPHTIQSQSGEHADNTDTDLSQDAIDQQMAEQEQHQEQQQLEHDQQTEQQGPPVSMPSLDDDGEGSQPSNTDQVQMDIDELQNAAESGQIKFILNENGQLLQLDNHILTTDADGNQILVQGTDSEQIQQLLQSVGVLHAGDGDGETFQMIQGENNQMILVQGDNNEAHMIDASMLNEDGHLVIQQHGDGEEMHVVNEDGVQVPVSIAFAQHVDDGGEQQHADIKMEGDSQDGQSVQVAVTEEGLVATTTATTVTSTAGGVFFNLEDLINQPDQK